MSRYHDEKYDQIKNLLNKSRLLKEQVSLKRDNLGKSIQDKINQDVDSEYEVADNGDEVEESPDDKVQKYRISGGIIALHGKEKSDVEITSEEKLAFQETMDEFVEDVSDLVDFNQLNVYTNSVEWSGKIIDEDVDFILTIGEDSGIYMDGKSVKVDQDFLTMINKLQQFYEKFKSKWSKVLAMRKKTKPSSDD
jgi:hypothetical protein